MIQTLIELCVRRRAAALLCTLLVAAYGVHAYRQTAIEAFPDVTNYQVNVIAMLPGLAPEEIERQLTLPLERVLNGTPDMVQMRSESLFGLSLLYLTFDDHADVFKARTRVQERIAGAELPEGVVPVLAPEATPLGKVFYYALESDRHSLHELRSEQEWNVARLLRQVPGVADVISFGGFLPELHVEVDSQRLDAWGLTLNEVTEALERSNLNVGGGFLRRSEQELVVRGIGALSNPRDLEAVVLRAEGGTPITVGDVARVVLSHTPRRGAVALDDRDEIVEGIVLLRRGENPSRVLDGVHAKVAELNATVLPDGMELVPIYDRSRLVDHTLSTVHDNLLHGFLLIVGVVWLFLRSVRGSAVVAVIIPLSLLSAFIGLRWLGLPANLISMGAIDFGILVDGAVVLVENVMHHARQHRPKSRRELIGLVARSALDVARPTFYAMAIIIAALIPVFTLERVEGRIFRPLALTYGFALAGALVFSLTVVPALCALLLRVKDVQGSDPKWLDALRDGYRRALCFLLPRKAWVFGAGMALLVAGAWVGTRLGSEFLPQLDEGDVVVFVELPPSVSLQTGQEIGREVRARLRQFPEVLMVLAEQGRPEDGTDNEGVNLIQVLARLEDRSRWRKGLTKDALVEQMRESLQEIPGVRFNFSQPIRDRIEESVSGVRGQGVLKLFGPDNDAMRATLQEALRVIAPIEGVVDLDLYRDSMVPQLQVRLDRQALARAGVPMAEALEAIETALAGRVTTEIWQGERAMPVRVRLDRAEVSDEQALRQVLVPTASGARVPLQELAAIELSLGQAAISREDNSRFLALKFNIEGRDMGAVIQEAQAAVAAQVKPPDGHFFRWTGEFENQQRAMERLKVIVPVSLVVVLLLLFGALGTLRGAGTVLAMAPWALTGGVFALWLGGIPLSVSAAVGFIALLGQVSLMGLLVVSAVDQKLEEGLPPAEAVIEGAVLRFRAVLMASALAALGLMPMAFSSGMGSETQRPFALVIVGGMVTTLAVGVFLLPAVYALWARKRPATGTEDEEVHAPGGMDDESKVAA